MAGSIICGVDDSESAKEAARVARALAAELRLGPSSFASSVRTLQTRR
jgi:hypothetical protein